MKIVLYSFINLVAVCILFSSCHSSERNKLTGTKPAVKKYQPGVVFTFDDDYIDDWYKADKVMQPYGWKATFFICKYGTFTAEQKQRLHYLKDRGHDIAGHGFNHQNAVKYGAVHGLDDYINSEILPLKAAMLKDGFNITSFAYHDGARNTDLDNKLFNYFTILRGTMYGKLPPQEQYCYYTGSKLIFGLGIDDDYKQFDVEYYKSLLDYAKKNNEIVLFYGHKTVNNADENLETPMAALKDLCKYAKDKDLKFYTVDDFSKL